MAIPLPFIIAGGADVCATTAGFVAVLDKDVGGGVLAPNTVLACCDDAAAAAMAVAGAVVVVVVRPAIG